ncbi:mechanosensitive ion channel family protein [Thiomicrospira cyclica]|uniref:Small-conductance mechanosensitive channel n=1 Tax=Thiomicrospira cyclica (strain DSM 14477 / JCM 11371 / ALM1) TaxID=717773 RepID=F6DBQ7_THICA|nr:mechanosensitive ion channel domain-containing protein [Thiomicrospira cyclica]AEG31293.1 MscS Mechanosensitive ion channel [Thiomicrospira cyclica ALM1]
MAIWMADIGLTHPLALAVGYLVIAMVVAWLINLVITLGPKRWAIKQQREILAYALIHIRLPIMVSVVFIAISMIMNLQFDFNEELLLYANRILTSINIMIWGQFIYRSSQFGLKLQSTRQQEGSFIRPQTLPVLDNLSAVLIVLVAVYLLFLTWNINMTAWLASAGVIGIAVGFAARDTLANILSGLFIMADSPFKIGDYIVVDGTDRGKVTQIGLRSTRILTRDDVEINIPNSVLANGKVVNQSSGRFVSMRMSANVGVSYDSDIDRVRQILLEVAQADPQVLQDPVPAVRFMGFGASSLDFSLRVWIADPEIRSRVLDSLNTQIFKRFQQAGIEIPYSKHDLYIKSLPPGLQDDISAQETKGKQ